MAFQPAPACASATMTYRSVTGNQFWGQNVLNFRKADGTAFQQGDADDLATRLQDWHADTLSEIQSASIQLTEIYVRGLASQVDVFSVLNPNHAGTQVGEAASSKFTIALKFGTGMTGRTARGRVYQCALSESQLEGKSVTVAYAAALIDAWELLPSVIGVSYEHVVLSRWENKVKRVTALPQVITSYSLADTILDTRRKRV